MWTINDFPVYEMVSRWNMHGKLTSTYCMGRSRVGWLSIVKTKPRSRVEVIHDGNDELTVGDDVFWLGELVNSYRVTSSNDLEEKSNFYITDNIFVDVYAKDLNDVLTSNGQTQVDENDDIDEINVEDCNEDEDKPINEEEGNSD